MRAFWRWCWSTRRRKWLTIALIFLVVMPGIGVEVSSQSWFCNSCHIMNSYYTSWQTSSHKDVACVSCHIAPGTANFVWAKLNGAGQVVDDLLNRTSTKPSASVSDFSCTRSGCHSLEQVRAIQPKREKYFFDHGKHLNLEHLGVEVHCTTCHSHVQGSSHFEVNTNVCITCHLITPGAAEPAIQLAALTNGKNGHALTQPATTQPVLDWRPILAAGADAAHAVPPRQCKTCHEPPTRPIEYRGLKVDHDEYLSYGAACESCHRNVTAKPQPIDSSQCYGCHDFGIEKMTGIPELHRQHAEGHHKVECFSCHGVIHHGPSAQLMRLDQMDCQSCHKQQHMIQRGTYKSANPMVHLPSDGSALSPMFMVHVDCTGCHVQEKPISLKPQSGALVAAATPEACDTCHKAGLGAAMVPLWQKSTRELYDGVLKLVPPNSDPGQQPLVAEARRLMEIVRMDGSWGVHNPRYTQKLLEQAKGLLLQAQPAPPSGQGAAQ